MKLSMVLIGTFAIVLTGCGSSSSSSNASATPASATSAAVASASDGAKVFDTNCSSCHGASGQGSPGAFPPLAGNPVASGDAAKMIGIVKNGLSGVVVVGGQKYNGVMPAWGANLSAADIASVITFVRSSWGNKGSAVTEAQVTAAK